MVSVCLVAIAAAAWLVTVRQAGSMSNMVNGLGQVGRRMPNKMGIAAFLGMWAAMMAAMMSPTLAPVVLAHRLVLRRREEGIASTVAFVAGYLAVWWLVGVAYLLPFLWFRGLPADAADSWWLPAVAGTTFVLAGAYQFTRWKAHCQGTCCAPLAFVLDHDPGNGVARAFRVGMSSGAHCLGCCWALMAVLLVVGLMNLVWMIALSLLFLAEKHFRRALSLGRVVGVALVILGLAVMLRTELLHTISGARAKAAPMGNMGTP